MQRYSKYGVELVHYDIMLNGMASFVSSMMPEGRTLTPQDLAAWKRVLGLIKAAAKRGYAEQSGSGNQDVDDLTENLIS